MISIETFRRATLVLATVVAIGAPSAVSAQCSAFTVTGNGTRDYLGCTELKNWANARTACQGIGVGWELASMANATENTLAGTVGSSNKWIGYNDIAVEGTFAWSDGSAVGYTSWNTGEPNNVGNEDCAVYTSATVWNDLACSSTRGFVCEGPAACGNGYRTSTEACDDGNVAAGDGCSATCTVEAGWTCNASQPTVCFAGCPAGGTASTNGSYDYIYCSSSVAWTAARDYCDATGAAWDLVWIDDAAENTYVRSLSGVAFHLGFNDISVEGSFGWYGGQPTLYTNWNGGEPNDSGGNEDCAEMLATGRWNDRACTTARRFVCKSLSGGCGNGAVLGGEACDDGDNNSGDGCSATCTIETGYTCTGSPSICTPICASGQYRYRAISGMPYTYREYYRCNSTVSWTGAETACGNLGAGWHLAAVGDLAEKNYIQGMIAATSSIGYTDAVTEGSFVWSNGEANAYTNWNGGEPNNSGNEDCTQMFTSGVWNDINCATANAFVCEQVDNAAVCGNGVIGDIELCDDGNLTNGDGCSDTCQVENFYECTMPVDGGAASICTTNMHVLLEDVRLINVGGTPVLEWKTASESGALGYFVTRLDEKLGRWVAVHDGMLLAPPSAAQGTVYRLADRGHSARGAVQYRLEEYERSGRRVTVESKPFAAVTDSSVRLPANGFEATPRVLRSITPKTVPGQGGVLVARAGRVPTGAVLSVANNGVQSVSVSKLAAALGRSANDVTAALVSGEVSISDQGLPVAWAFDADADEVVFVGAESASAYSATRPYMVTMDAGSVFESVDARSTGSASVGVGRVVTNVEHDTFAGLVAATDPNADYWFDAVLSAGAANTSSYTTNVLLAQVPAQSVSLEARVYGAWNVNGEHPQHVTVLVNGQAAGEFDVSAIGAVTKTFTVPASKFVAGANTLKLVATTEGGAGMGGMYVDGFTIDAVTELDLGVDQVRFTAVSNGALSAMVDGSDVRVFDVTAKKEILPAASSVLGATEVRFVAAKGHEYVLSARSAFRDLGDTAIRSAYDGLGNRKAGGDLVIVTPHAMRAAADKLAALREKEGLKVLVVELEDLWDRFGGGLARPSVITDMLREGEQSWSTVPRYMVLIGDGTFDYRNVMGVGAGAMPPQMVATHFGLYASDSSLADLDNDGVPELAVGRLPAHTVTEASHMVDRLEAYQGREFADFTHGATLVAGRSRGVDFGADVTRLAGTLPNKTDVHALLTNGMPFEVARDGVLQALDEGSFWFHYVGHGGLDRLDDNGLLTAADVNALNNGGLAPIVTGMTCSISRYEVPGMASLGDALLLGETGGAIAVWAPTGVSTSFESTKVSTRFGKVLLRDSANTASRSRLGDVLLRTHEEAIHEKLAPADMMSIFALLGDPSMRLPDLSELKEAEVQPPTDEPAPVADAGAPAADGAGGGSSCAMTRQSSSFTIFFAFVAMGLLLMRRRRA